MKTRFTLDEIGALCDRNTRSAVARHFGGVRRLGRDTAVPLFTIATVASVFDAFKLLGESEWDSVNDARAFVVALARLALPVYQRHQPHDGTIAQALQAAEDYSAGRERSVALEAAHKLAIVARDRVVLPHGVRPPEYHAADAAVAASEPFATPQKMVTLVWWRAYQALRGANGGYDRAEGIVKVLGVNQATYFRLEEDAKAAGCLDLLTRYHALIREGCNWFLKEDQADREQVDQTLIKLLETRFEAGSTS